MSQLTVKKTIETYSRLKLATKHEETQKLVRIAYSRFDIYCRNVHENGAEEIIDEMALAIKTDEDEVFDILQDAINWLYQEHEITRTFKRRGKIVNEKFILKYSARSLRTWFSNLRGYLYYRKVKLDDMAVRHNLNFPKAKKEKKYVLTKKNIDLIFDNATRAQKNFYLALISSGMRDGEALMIQRKHLELGGKRVKINIPSTIAKHGVSRTTFLSFEASDPIIARLETMEPESKVWGSDGAKAKNDRNEQIRDYEDLVDRIGLGMRYESTKRRKITLHLFRSFFITKGKKVEDLGHALAGHDKYMDEYERYSDDELEELYVNGLERYVLVYDKNAKQKEIDTLTKQTENQKVLERKIEAIEKKNQITSATLSEADIEKIVADYLAKKEKSKKTKKKK